MGARPRQPRVRQRVDPKPAAGDQIVDLAVEMTAARDARPQRIEPILPARDARLRRAAVLDEQQRRRQASVPGAFRRARAVHWEWCRASRSSPPCRSLRRPAARSRQRLQAIRQEPTRARPRSRAMRSNSGDGSSPMTDRTDGPYSGRLSPEPMPISRTRPSAAPITRRRNGTSASCRIARCSRYGSTWRW